MMSACLPLPTFFRKGGGGGAFIWVCALIQMNKVFEFQLISVGLQLIPSVYV